MEHNSGSHGLSLSTVLTVIFIVLKLVGVINCSWLLVFLPLIISVVFWVVFVVVLALYNLKLEKEFETMRKGKDKWRF